MGLLADLLYEMADYMKWQILNVIIILIMNVSLLGEPDWLDSLIKELQTEPCVKKKFEHIKEYCNNKDFSVCETILKIILESPISLCFTNENMASDDFFHGIGTFLIHDNEKVRNLSIKIVNQSIFFHARNRYKKFKGSFNRSSLETRIEITPYIIEAMQKRYENQEFSELCLIIKEIIQPMVSESINIKDDRLSKPLFRMFYYKFNEYELHNDSYIEMMIPNFYSDIISIMIEFEEGCFYLKQFFKTANETAIPHEVYSAILYYLTKKDTGITTIIELLEDWPDSYINSASHKGFRSQQKSDEIKSNAVLLQMILNNFNLQFS